MSEFDPVETISVRLRRAMKIKHMKQVDLVKATGIDKGRISRYLSNEYEPKNKSIYELARALDVSEQWLMGYDAPMERPQTQKNNDVIADIVLRMQSDELFLSFVKAGSKLDSDKLSSLLNLLK